MKRIILTTITILVMVMMVACGANNGETTEKPKTTEQMSAQPAKTTSPEPKETEQEAPKNAAYEFEFTDIDGNVHKLSDYRGKPVYLRVWASWCSVCTSSLDSFDKLAGEAEDFVVLSVVMPSLSGELSAEKFTEWYNAFGYENIVVMLDNDGQIVRDFGINAFPSQIIFDAEGKVLYGFAGLMPSDMITETMQRIAEESA